MTECTNCPQAGKHPFCGLEQESKVFLESNSIQMECSCGTILFREGDRGDAVFVMCSGHVKLSATSREGHTIILRVADAGDVLGMSAALTDSEYEVTAEAIAPCRIRVLTSKYFHTMLQRHPAAAFGGISPLPRKKVKFKCDADQGDGRCQSK